MKIIAVLSLAMAIVLPAGSECNGFELWTPSQLKALERQLSVRLDAQKFAAQGLGTFGNHSFMIAHREGNGQAELHQTQNDVFLVQSGQATLVVGGTLVEPKTVAAHEIRGSSISGGERKALGPAMWFTSRRAYPINCWWMPERNSRISSLRLMRNSAGPPL